jgi:hypothetical protein
MQLKQVEDPPPRRRRRKKNDKNLGTKNRPMKLVLYLHPCSGYTHANG